MPVRVMPGTTATILLFAMLSGCVEGESLGPVGHVQTPVWAPGHMWEWQVEQRGWVEDGFSGRVDVGDSWSYTETVRNANVPVGDTTAYWLETSGASPRLLTPGIFPNGGHLLVDKADLGALGYVYVDAPQGCTVAFLHPFAAQIDLLRFPLADNARWSGEANGLAYYAAVAGAEPVETPAGTFDAVRIDVAFDRVDALYPDRRVVSASLGLTLWYAPAVERFVRLVEDHHVAFETRPKGGSSFIMGIAPERGSSDTDSVARPAQTKKISIEMTLDDHTLATSAPAAPPTVLTYGQRRPPTVPYPLQVYRHASADGTNLAAGAVELRLRLAEGHWETPEGQEIVVIETPPDAPWFDPTLHRIVWILSSGLETEIVRTNTPFLDRTFDAVARWTIDAEIEPVPSDACAPAHYFAADVRAVELPISWEARYGLDHAPGPRVADPPLDEIPTAGHAKLMLEWSKESLHEAAQDRTRFYADDLYIDINDGTGAAELPVGPESVWLRWDVRGPGTMDVDNPILVGHSGHLDIRVVP